MLTVLLSTDLDWPGVGPELGQQSVDLDVAARQSVDTLRHDPVTVHELDTLQWQLWDWPIRKLYWVRLTNQKTLLCQNYQSEDITCNIDQSEDSMTCVVRLTNAWEHGIRSYWPIRRHNCQCENTDLVYNNRNIFMSDLLVPQNIAVVEEKSSTLCETQKNGLTI